MQRKTSPTIHYTFKIAAHPNNHIYAAAAAVKVDLSITESYNKNIVFDPKFGHLYKTK